MNTTKWAYTDSSTLTYGITWHTKGGGGGIILLHKATNLVLKREKKKLLFFESL